MPEKVMLVGPFLSILLPLIGPAVAIFPTESAMLRLFVDALFVSVPAGTFVVRLSHASAAFRPPAPPSLAVQPIETSFACHAPSGDPQVTAGAFRSILLPLIGPAVTVCPTASL